MGGGGGGGSKVVEPKAVAFDVEATGIVASKSNWGKFDGDKSFAAAMALLLLFDEKPEPEAIGCSSSKENTGRAVTASERTYSFGFTTALGLVLGAVEDGTAKVGTIGAAALTLKSGNALGTDGACVTVLLEELLLDFSPNANILGTGSLDGIGEGVVGSGW